MKVCFDVIRDDMGFYRGRGDGSLLRAASQRFDRIRSSAFSVQPANEIHKMGDRGGGMGWGACKIREGVWEGVDTRDYLTANKPKWALPI